MSDFVSVTTENKTAQSLLPFTAKFGSGGTIGPSTLDPSVAFAVGTGPRDISVGDFDGDGWTDVVTTNRFSASISVLRNRSSVGNPMFLPHLDLTAGSYPSGIAVGDIDGDGRLDIVVTNNSSNTVSLYRNTSSPGTLSFVAQISIAAGAYPSGVTLSDVNGDGLLDIIVTNTHDKTISILPNKSTPGSFAFGTLCHFRLGVDPWRWLLVIWMVMDFRTL